MMTTRGRLLWLVVSRGRYTPAEGCRPREMAESTEVVRGPGPGPLAALLHLSTKRSSFPQGGRVVRLVACELKPGSRAGRIVVVNSTPAGGRKAVAHGLKRTRAWIRGRPCAARSKPERVVAEFPLNHNGWLGRWKLRSADRDPRGAAPAGPARSAPSRAHE